MVSRSFLVVLALLAPRTGAAQGDEPDPLAGLEPELALDDVDADPRLGPERRVAVVAFPLEVLASAAGGRALFGAEVRLGLTPRLAITLKPIAAWLFGGHSGDGFGAGGAVGLHWYTRRLLSGPFVGVQAGDIEAFRDGRRGRSAGGGVVFGYSVSYADGGIVCVGVGFGYWHRMGVVAGGPNLPEILSLRLDTGWGWGGRSGDP